MQIHVIVILIKPSRLFSLLIKPSRLCYCFSSFDSIYY